MMEVLNTILVNILIALFFYQLGKSTIYVSQNAFSWRPRASSKALKLMMRKALRRGWPAPIVFVLAFLFYRLLPEVFWPLIALAFLIWARALSQGAREALIETEAMTDMIERMAKLSGWAMAVIFVGIMAAARLDLQSYW